MVSGSRSPDLGRILHDAEFVVPRCEVCNTLSRVPMQTKARAIATARRHAAAKGHTVTLYLTHWQRVHPPEKV